MKFILSFILAASIALADSYVPRTQSSERFPLSKWTGMQFSSAKVNATGSPKLNVLFTGDSLMANDIITWRRMLADRFGWAGYGIGATAAFGHAGTAANVSNAFTLWPTGEYTNIPAGGSVKFNFNSTQPIVCDTIKVYYIKESGAGTFAVALATDAATFVNETGHTAVSAANASTIGAVDSLTVKSVPDTYTVRITAATAAVKILGVSMVDSTKRGVVASTIAYPGTNLLQNTTTPVAITSPIIADIAPDLVFYKETDDDTYQSTYLPTLYSNIRAGFASNDWVLIAMHAIAATGATSAESQNPVIRSVALANAQSYFDDYTWSGPNASAITAGWQNGDGVHRTAAGAQIGISYLLDQLPISSAYGVSSFYKGYTILGTAATQADKAGWINENADATTGGIVLDLIKHKDSVASLLLKDQTNTTVSGFYMLPNNDGTGRANAWAFLGANGAAAHILMPNGNAMFGNSILPLARLHITGTADGTKPSVLVDGGSGQTGNLTEWRLNGGANVATMSTTGVLATSNPKFSAYNSGGTQTITTGTFSKVLFATEEFDTAGVFASSRLTATAATAGYWHIDATVNYQSGASATNQTIEIYKGTGAGAAAQYRRIANMRENSTGQNGASGGIIVSLASTDFIEIYTYQDSGGNRALEPGTYTAVYGSLLP